MIVPERRAIPAPVASPDAPRGAIEGSHPLDQKRPAAEGPAVALDAVLAAWGSERPPQNSFLNLFTEHGGS